jgi:hypothetical protein
MRTLDTWWSPAATCWRIEDGEMFTYYDLDLVISHLRDRGATALLVAPPHDMHTAMLDLALRRAGISIVYAPA